MTVQECMGIFCKEHPERTIKVINDAGKLFFITAPHKDVVGVDYSDPFFLIKKCNGECSHFLPAADFRKYEKYVNSPIVFIE